MPLHYYPMHVDLCIGYHAMHAHMFTLLPTLRAPCLRSSSCWSPCPSSSLRATRSLARCLPPWGQPTPCRTSTLHTINWYVIRDQSCSAATHLSAYSFVFLLVHNPTQTGTLPSDIASVLSLTGYSGMLDTRLNFMCCCGIGGAVFGDNANDVL